jgi:quinol monooxygenase YgiN
MHILIVTFQLKDLTEEAFRALCDGLAPSFAAVPGLLSKVWLASPATNTYGGVYTWRDRQAMEDYTASELFSAVVAHPHFAGVTATDFGVLDGPTRITHGPAPVPAAAAA